MIAAIADDLTGAAEIGGIALRYGLQVVIDTRVHEAPDVDVLVISPDTRSKSIEEARTLTKEATKDLLALNPEFIFKKTDSLMRGYVAEELLAQMQASGKQKALLIPANPALKRTIRAGLYYADDVPLHQSDLADAARKKIATSNVLNLIGQEFRSLTKVLSLNDAFPLAGIAIGNTLSESDLDEWAKKIDADTIPAGSGGFFDAVLKNRINAKQPVRQEAMVVGKKILYVCGSAFPLSKANVVQARKSGRCVAYMPETIFCEGIDRNERMRDWIDEIVQGLRKEGAVIVAVGDLRCNDTTDIANSIRRTTALVIEQVMQRTEVDEMVIEGGATASSIIEKLHYERFYPAQELAQGVLRMKVQGAQGLYLTMKPGSYQWPASIWRRV